MPKYVPAQGETWHWCRNCSNYPSRAAKMRRTRPRGGQVGRNASCEPSRESRRTLLGGHTASERARRLSR